MTRLRRTLALAMGIGSLAACQPSYETTLSSVIGGPTAVARETRLEQALAKPDTTVDSASPVARWLLPSTLSEISGLALTHDGRLLVHGDELGQVWEVDYRRGVLVKRFSLGSRAVHADFEGMTIAHDVVWMLASDGTLYEFREGANGAHVTYKVHDTGLKRSCEFEGVAFDPAIDALLLACKKVHDASLRDMIVIHRWSLAADGDRHLPPLTVPIAGLGAVADGASLAPSDITVDPRTGNYVLVASKKKALVVLTPAGAVVLARPLPPNHDQPEGVAVTKNGLVIVSDEAGQGPAVITVYRWR